MLSPMLRAGLALTLLASSLQAQATTVFAESFETGGTLWSQTGLFNVPTSWEPCLFYAYPFPSGERAAWFGDPTSCSFNTRPTAQGELRMEFDVPLPANVGSASLSFATFSVGEDSEQADRRRIFISNDAGQTWNQLGSVYSSWWTWQQYDLTAYLGQAIRVRFEFDAVDSNSNSGLGWLLDDVQIETRDAPGTPFCFGDYTSYACPCANFGGFWRGCASSVNPDGALLQSSGQASIAQDTLRLSASGMPDSIVNFFQGTEQLGIGQMETFGDGLRCTQGTIVRLKVAPVSLGSFAIPAPGDAPVSVTGNVTVPGTTRYYQAAYRNAGSFCTPSTFNATNGVIVTWQL